MSPSNSLQSTSTLFWILRIGAAMEFVGHGMVGLGHPPAWAAYFGVVGIHESTAFGLMPVVGAVDVLLGIAVLLYPCRALAGYMALWGLWTALLRPLSGEPVWEAVERAGNYGAPLALCFLFATGGVRAWLASRPLESLTKTQVSLIKSILIWTTALLLLGHGALGALMQKKLLQTHYASIGLPGDIMVGWIGWFEIILAIAVALKPLRSLLIFVLIWKLATELLSPMAGSSMWVFIEHGGSYVAPLALIFMNRVMGSRTEDDARLQAAA